MIAKAKEIVILENVFVTLAFPIMIVVYPPLAHQKQTAQSMVYVVWIIAFVRKVIPEMTVVPPKLVHKHAQHMVFVVMEVASVTQVMKEMTVVHFQLVQMLAQTTAYVN